jgi:hypothetical protein
MTCPVSKVEVVARAVEVHGQEEDAPTQERDPKVPLESDGAGTPSPRITCVLTKVAVHGFPGVRGRKERAFALFHLAVALSLSVHVKVARCLAVPTLRVRVDKHVLMSAEEHAQLAFGHRVDG